jgi:hypothetical protein
MPVETKPVIPNQKTAKEWEQLYMPQLLTFEQGLGRNLEQYLAGASFFDNLPYTRQWEMRNYLLQLRSHLELYQPTADWFTQQQLPDYAAKLQEMKTGLDEVIEIIVNKMDNPIRYKAFQPFGPPPSPIPPGPHALPVAEQTNYNQKMLEIMQQSQKDSFDHYQKMHEIQQKITDSINEYRI